MTSAQQKQRWQQLLRDALAQQPIPDGPHVAQDDNQVVGWLEGRLDKLETDAFWQHLALCPSCREEVMLIVEMQPDPAETTVLPAPRVKPRSHSPWAILAGLAACIALALGVYWLTSPADTLDAVRASLERKDPARALAQLDRLLARPGAVERTEALQLAEEAGYQLAREQLLARNFAAVNSTAQRLSAWQVDSDRLANLRFQAEHRIHAEVTLALAPGLIDYQYELDGSAPGKPAGGPQEIKPDLEAYVHRLLDAHPKSVALHLNLAHWLFQQGLKEDAFKVLRKARDLDPTDPLVRVGLGLIHYDWEEYPQALTEFSAALKTRPDDALLHVNVAMTLERLNQDARAAWHRARSLMSSEELKQRIDAHLANRLKD